MKKFSRFSLLTFAGFGLLVVTQALMSHLSARAQAVAVQRDVIYGEAGGQKLRLDVYGADPKTKHPALILVHGGGWAMGSKTDTGSTANFFASQGYVCFSIDYRLVTASANKYPAQLDDTQRAVRWVRAHAQSYGVDANRLGAIGDSAGGHLVALLGTRDTRDNSDKMLASYSSRVKCVVDLYGPTYFSAALSPAALQLLSNFLGKPITEAPALYRQASPLTYVNAKSAPFLIFHGGKDPLVPLDQSKRLNAALKAVGVESHLTVFPLEGHGFSDRKDIESMAKESLVFLNRHLK